MPPIPWPIVLPQGIPIGRRRYEASQNQTEVLQTYICQNAWEELRGPNTRVEDATKEVMRPGRNAVSQSTY